MVKRALVFHSVRERDTEVHFEVLQINKRVERFGPCEVPDRD